MKVVASHIRLAAKGVFVGIAIMFSTASFAKDVETIGYKFSSSRATLQVRKVETTALDAQKRVVMKTVLYVTDTEAEGKIDTQVIGAETRVFDPNTGKVTHVSLVGVAAYPVEANGAYVIIAPGARNVSVNGDNNQITMGGNLAPSPLSR